MPSEASPELDRDYGIANDGGEHLEGKSAADQPNTEAWQVLCLIPCLVFALRVGTPMRPRPIPAAAARSGPSMGSGPFAVPTGS